jgi:UDP-glucose 4-epimerase
MKGSQKVLDHLQSLLNCELAATGGAGYIGSHTCVELLAAGHDCRRRRQSLQQQEAALERVQEIAGRPLAFVKADLRDGDALMRCFANTASTP